MIEPVVAPRAQRDLRDIFQFISVDSETAAWSVLQRIENMIVLLGERPYLGPVAGLPFSPELRKMSVPPYIIFYRLPNRTVEIVRVFHSARDLKNPDLFRGR